MTYHIHLIMQTNKIYIFRQILIYHLPKKIFQYIMGTGI